MWINPMLTIWLYGTLFSLATIVLTLWLWYWRDPYDEHTAATEADRPLEGEPGGQR